MRALNVVVGVAAAIVASINLPFGLGVIVGYVAVLFVWKVVR